MYLNYYVVGDSGMKNGGVVQEIKEYKNNLLKSIDETQDVTFKDKCAGIYMIFIKDMEMKTIIPVYIGQSKNLYNRIANHKVEIRKLLSVDKDTYNSNISKNAGKYIYCKIVSTLLNNHKDFDDICFRVIEYCSNKDLDEREQYYINNFGSIRFGFNQMNCIVETNKVINEVLYGDNIKVEYYKELKGLVTHILKELNSYDINYRNYGFQDLNYLLLIGNINKVDMIYHQYKDRELSAEKITKLIEKMNKEKSKWINKNSYFLKIMLMDFEIESFDFLKEKLGVKVAFEGIDFNLKKTEERIKAYIGKIEKTNPGQFTINGYKTLDEPVSIHCNNCGYDFSKKADLFLKGHSCPYCKPNGIRRIRNNNS